MKEFIKLSNEKGAAQVETGAKVEVIHERGPEPNQGLDQMVDLSLIQSWDFSRPQSKTKKINNQEELARLKLEILQEGH